LYVSLDKTDALVAKIPYQQAGCATQFLTALKLQAKDSVVQIDTLKVFTVASSPANIFRSLTLVDDQGNVLAVNPNVQLTTIFTNAAKVSDQPRTIYLKADLNKIGKDEVGQIDATAYFRFGGISASYVGGKKAADIIYENNPSLDRTNPSDTIAIVAARIAAVDLVNSNQTVTVANAITDTGWLNTAIVRVATNGSSNTTLTGYLARIILDKIRINFQKNSGMTIGEVQIARVWPKRMVFISAPYSTTTEFDLADSAISADKEIEPITSAYFLVRVNISSLDGSGQNWIEASLDNLDGNASTANFVWRDGDDASQKFPLKLSVSLIAGTKITE
jgi:hypothetical protein